MTQEIVIIISCTVLIALLVLFLVRMRFISAFTIGFILVFLFQSGFFMVTEGSAVVITQFGHIIGKPYEKAGLYIKVPLIWKANYLDSRIHSNYESQPGIATKDGYFIAMDSVFLWRIVDFDKYISTVDDTPQAETLLRNIVSGSVRQQVSKRDILDSIQAEHSGKNEDSTIDSSLSQVIPNREERTMVASSDLIFKRTQQAKFSGRNQLIEDIMTEINMQSEAMGVVIDSFLITSVRYTKDVLKLMDDRMIAERLREAEKIHAKGVAEVKRINGLEKKTIDEIIAPARKKALVIIGQAEAYAADISSKSFGKNRGFYNYWKSLTNYTRLLDNKKTTMLLSTDTPYLDFIGNAKKTISRSNTYHNKSKKVEEVK